MIALVYTGKLKDPELLYKMAKVDDKYIAMATHLVEGFKGGVVLGKDDGTFFDCSYWESKEDIDRVTENEVVKKILSATEDLVEGSYHVEHYDILMKY
jgi:heme-degrading monooxygenase HmoA